MRFQRKSVGHPLDERETVVDFLLLEDEGRLGEKERARLEAWLAAKPENHAAWTAAHRVLAVVGEHAADPQVMELRRAALAARPPRRRRFEVWVAAGLAAAVVVAVGVGLDRPAQIKPAAPAPLARTAVAPAPPARPTLYRTAIGERSTISLPDGSVATLDTSSELRVAFSASERAVRLTRGQAIFEVAKNKAWPFNVYVAGRRITAVGTKFNVRLEGRSVRVALIEGVIQVTEPPPPGGPRALPQVLTLAAGEVLEAAPGEPMRVAAGDPQRLASWESGVLVFEDEPLATAVAQMNRYTERPIVLAAPSGADLRLNGVFRTGDPERFAQAMTDAFPLELSHSPDGSPVLSARKARR